MGRREYISKTTTSVPREPRLIGVTCYYVFILMKYSFCIKGVEQFHEALHISPKNVAAHYGLASGLLSLSKECINLGAFKWGASLLEVKKHTRNCFLDFSMHM